MEVLCQLPNLQWIEIAFGYKDMLNCSENSEHSVARRQTAFVQQNISSLTLKTALK